MRHDHARSAFVRRHSCRPDSRPRARGAAIPRRAGGGPRPATSPGVRPTAWRARDARPRTRRSAPGCARRHRLLPLDPADALDRGPGLRGHRRLGHPDRSQNLDLMPCHRSDHSSPFPRRRCATADVGRSVTSEPSAAYQNFRKWRDQKSRNPHAVACRHAAECSARGATSAWSRLGDDLAHRGMGRWRVGPSRVYRGL